MEDKTGKQLFFKIILYIATLAFGVVLGLWQIQPPAPPHEGMRKYTVYQRMLDNIQTLAAQPHPSGSPEIENVRAQIISEIETMGLTPVVHRADLSAIDIADAMAWLENTTKEDLWEQSRDKIAKNYRDVNNLDEYAAAQRRNYLESGMLHLENILVKLDAPGTEQGIMFVSHYDSAPRAPGAADDMIAVCSMLEAMRAQTQQDELKNDIYFLLTDGEEIGLLGVWAFIGAHPDLYDKIGCIINIEARGNRGGLILFETSPGAYPLMNFVARSGAKPIGFSFAASIYSMMPNYTDFTAFLRAGYKGVNLAIIEGVENYHRFSDNFDNLNSATAWHYLHTVLALASYAANNPLDDLLPPPLPQGEQPPPQDEQPPLQDEQTLSSQDAVYFPFLPGIMVLISVTLSHILCAATCIFIIASVIIKVKKKIFKVSFSIVIMILFLLLSIISSIYFASGSYLFYIPLFFMTISKMSMLTKWPIARIAAQATSRFVTLLLWVPLIYLVWISLLQPMML